MHQQPPKMPLLRSTKAANAAHVDSSRALTVYAGATTKPSLPRRLTPNSTFAVLGTAHVQERPVRHGTFVLLIHRAVA